MKKSILILVSGILLLAACEQHHCPTYNDAGPKHHHKAPGSHLGK